MKIKLKYIFIPIFLIFLTNLYSYEIIRDPIFEDYFYDISIEFKHKEINVYLIKSKTPNAFVFNDKIYFTTGLLNEINNEDTLKSIYLHEYGHIINNHLQSKKIKNQQASNKNTLYNLLSVGMAVLVGDVNLGLGTSITLNTNLINEISQHSVNFEIEADNYMVDQIKKNKINTSELISFLKKVSHKGNNYFRSHPRIEDRINSLAQINYKKKENSIKFEWIKSKYSQDSNYETFNNFFKNLEKGIFNQNERLYEIDDEMIQYEAFKRGILVNNWDDQFQNLLNLNSNSFLKIEYINYLLDNNLENKYLIIEDLKFDKNLMSEYFYYYIYGKYYNKIFSINLSNFYFCQFYKIINSKKKSDFFCKKYNIKDIPILDKSYALFK